MYAIKRYSDLLVELRLCKQRINDLEFEIRIINKQMIKPPAAYKSIDYSGMPKGSQDYTSLDRLVERKNNLLEQLQLEYELKEQMMKSKRNTESLIKKLEGNEYKIAYKHLIENKTLMKISNEIDMSYKQVKRIWSRIKDE